jgi:hypothetical protein
MRHMNDYVRLAAFLLYSRRTMTCGCHCSIPHRILGVPARSGRNDKWGRQSGEEGQRQIRRGGKVGGLFRLYVPERCVDGIVWRIQDPMAALSSLVLESPPPPSLPEPICTHVIQMPEPQYDTNAHYRISQWPLVPMAARQRQVEAVSLAVALQSPPTLDLL